MRAVAAVLFAVSACLVLPACAVNGHGLAWVDWYQGEQGCARRMRTFGVHVITEAGAEGCVIGWSDLFVCYPRIGAAPFECADMAGDLQGWLAGGALEPVDGEELEPAPLAGGPIACCHTTLGVALATCAQRIGVSVGYRQRAEVAIPRDFDGVTFFDLDTDDPGACAYGIWEMER